MKELNLSIIGVEEMNDDSMSLIDGGGIVRDIYDVILDIDDRWDSFWTRFEAGWDSYTPNCA